MVKRANGCTKHQHMRFGLAVEFAEFSVHLDDIFHQIKAIVAAVKTALDNTPPELVGDIAERGIFLTGGGALLRRLDVLLAEATGVPVYLTKDPLATTVIGTGKVLDNILLLGKVAC